MKLKKIGVIALLPLAACADTPPNELAADAAPVVAAPAPAAVTVTTRDFEFDMPDTLSAGTVTFTLVNEGPELHHLSLVRLDGGHTAEEFSEAMQAGRMPEWAVDVGGPNPAVGAPGTTSNTTVTLEPGNYLALCFIPSADGTPHVMKGMVKAVTVVPATGPAAPLPEADIVMTLNDYSFTTSAPITAGKHVLRIENAAAQTHEVVIVKLEPGKSPMDVAKFLEKPEGPPPGAPVGGVAGISKGKVATIEIDFAPGEYALLCFIPDAGDGRPHVLHGMAQQITVN